MTTTKASKKQKPLPAASIRADGETVRQVRAVGRRYGLPFVRILDAAVANFARLPEKEQMRILFDPKDDQIAG